jgi:preprotein translocase subunit SecF
MGVLHRLYHGETKVDFIGKRRLWFAISGLILLASLASIIFRGFNFGIEFKGGVSIQAPISASSDLASKSDLEVIAAVRDAVTPAGAPSPQIQVSTSSTSRQVIVQTAAIDDPVVRQKVKDAVSSTVGATDEETTFQSIGTKWGGEITQKAIRALIIFLLVILAFISWRFEPKMAIAAIIALIHDLAITAGVYSLVGFQVTPSTIIAILTILGYSLYDTVVVFDKVEEDTALYARTGRLTYQDSANLAMNQVFARSLNTSLTTLLPVAALLVVGAGLAGAETLVDLALALFVGILAGTYSSIFIATPVLSMLKEQEPKYKNTREKILRDAKKSAAGASKAKRPAPVAAPADIAAADTASEAESTPAPVAVASPRPSGPKRPSGSRPRAGSKKSARRKRR